MIGVETLPRAPTRAEAFRYWFRLGCPSFGGPAGQIAIMHTELVERRRWISEKRFLHALNFCMVLPGPEAQQLATYIGWLMHRTWGGIVAGGLFVLPSLFVLIALSWLYMAFGNVPAIEALVMTGTIREYILDPDQTYKIRDAMNEGQYYGMQTFDQSLIALYQAGRITLESALATAANAHDFRIKLREIGVNVPTASATQ